MSDNRKILQAKRKSEREKCSVNSNKNNQDFSNSRRGVKRPNCAINTPKKNLANDRLKRLRCSLNQEVKQSSSCNNMKALKRLSSKPLEIEAQPLKLPKLQNDEEKMDSFEAMEWTPTDDSSSSSDLKNADFDSFNQRTYIIVVDTNIFLSNLQILKDIINLKTIDVTPIIFIPWMVMEELDYLKEDSVKSAIKIKAQEAIKYIETILISKNERMRGQTLAEANDQLIVGRSPDNKILGCCLQLMEKNQNLIFLTNDINLRNKALVNDIPVCSGSEIMVKIQRQNRLKSQIIMEKMTDLCGAVIRECAKKAYGPACDKMEICKLPLKSIHDCIGIFTKYWFPVFEEVLLKQFRKAISDLASFLTNFNNRIFDGSNELNELVRLCVRICIFMKDIDCCRNLIESTINELDRIKKM